MSRYAYFARRTDFFAPLRALWDFDFAALRDLVDFLLALFFAAMFDKLLWLSCRAPVSTGPLRIGTLSREATNGRLEHVPGCRSAGGGINDERPIWHLR